MTERQRVAMAKLVEVIECEFTNALGRNAAEYMPRVHIRARAGEPNWHAEFEGTVGISIFGAFLESLDRVRALYDLDADARLALQGSR
jgi:hypothetical protein